LCFWCREKQAHKLRLKLEDEQAELAEIKKQLEEERIAADATKKRITAEQAQWRRENDKRIAAKQAARAKENEEDARLIDATMKALEKREKDRQQALKDFHVHSSFSAKAVLLPLTPPQPSNVLCIDHELVLTCIPTFAGYDYQEG
jgi:Na+-translocating ferredoxin:NAD+ oxidoreductase RnfC subunit